MYVSPNLGADHADRAAEKVGMSQSKQPGGGGDKSGGSREEDTSRDPLAETRLFRKMPVPGGSGGSSHPPMQGELFLIPRTPSECDMTTNTLYHLLPTARLLLHPIDQSLRYAHMPIG